MSETTLIEFRDMLPELVSIPDDTVTQFLNDAKNSIVGYVAVEHSRFSELQRYMAAHLMSVAGIAGKDVVSESVADVSRSYANPQLRGYAGTNWEREFNRVRTQVEGMVDRCL